MTNDLYAFTAAATRGSAGVELLAVADAAADPDVELPDVLAVLGVVTWLSGALGPGFGELPLHPATVTAAIAAAMSAIRCDLGIDRLPSRG